MAYLTPESPPEYYNTQYIKVLVERLRTAVNYLDADNFPNGLDGEVLEDGSVDVAALCGLHLTLPIINLAEAYTTNSTSPVQIGGLVKWASEWTNVQIQLVISAYVTAGTGTVVLKDDLDATICTLSVTNTTLDLVESALCDLTSHSYFKLYVNVDDGLNDLQILSANILVYPKI